MKRKFLGFHALVFIREILSNDVSIRYYCKTDIGEANVISFIGVWTDRDTLFESSHENMSAEKKFSSKHKIWS